MQGHRGYTLVEVMLIVLLISTFMTTCTFALLGQILPLWNVRRTSMDIAVTLRAARAKAVREQTDITVPFDIDRRCYTLVSETAPGGVIIEQVDGETVRLAKLPTGVGFVRPDEGKAVTFSPPGAPDEEAAVFDSGGMLQSSVKPGDVYLGVPGKGIFRRVRVSLIGTVKVESWNGTSWK